MSAISRRASSICTEIGLRPGVPAAARPRRLRRGGRADIVAPLSERAVRGFVSDIFREIDEELRRENLLKLWSRYGRYVIAVAVFLLLVAGGIAVWRSHQRALREAQSERFAAALSLFRDGKYDEAGKLFQAVGREGGGYATLAGFEQAAALAKQGDRKGAVAAYDRIAASPAAPPFHDLAVLLAALEGMPDMPPQATIDRLKPLTESGNPWRPTALDLTAVAELKAGDREAALAIYRSLATDASAPTSLRTRAAEMAAALKS
jgi:hypothetical protein